MRVACVGLVTAIAALYTLTARVAPRPNVDWPAFRGVEANGVAEGPATPAAFTIASAVWKTPIPGLGHSSPVISGNDLCVTTAISGRTDAGVKPGLYGNVDSVQ